MTVVVARGGGQEVQVEGRRRCGAQDALDVHITGSGGRPVEVRRVDIRDGRGRAQVRDDADVVEGDTPLRAHIGRSETEHRRRRGRGERERPCLPYDHEREADATGTGVGECRADRGAVDPDAHRRIGKWALRIGGIAECDVVRLADDRRDDLGDRARGEPVEIERLVAVSGIPVRAVQQINVPRVDRPVRQDWRVGIGRDVVEAAALNDGLLETAVLDDVRRYAERAAEERVQVAVAAADLEPERVTGRDRDRGGALVGEPVGRRRAAAHRPVVDQRLDGRCVDEGIEADRYVEPGVQPFERVGQVDGPGLRGGGLERPRRQGNAAGDAEVLLVLELRDAARPVACRGRGGSDGSGSSPDPRDRGGVVAGQRARRNREQEWPDDEQARYQRDASAHRAAEPGRRRVTGTAELGGTRIHSIWTPAPKWVIRPLDPRTSTVLGPPWSGKENAVTPDVL